MVKKRRARNGKINKIQGNSSVSNMDKDQETGFVASQDNVLKDDDIEQTNTEKCCCIIVHRHLKEYLEKKWFNIIYKRRSKFNPNEWRTLKLDEMIVLVKSDMLKSLVIDCFDLFVVANYQDLSSSNTSSALAGATAPDPCDCFDSFSVLRDILYSEENNNWAFFWKCHGKTFLYFGDEQTTISIEDFNTLEVIVDEIRKLDHQAKGVFNTRIPLGETENGVGNVITSHVVSQEDFFKETNEIVYQKRLKTKQLNSFIILHCGIVEVVDEVHHSQNSKDSSSNVESPGASPKNTVNNDDLRALLAGSSIPLRTLLQCIVVRLTPTNWQELRRCVSRDIPLRVLENIPNNIEFFQELENRELIQIGDTDYLSSGLYEIERVDLVHLLDCIQDGDYSLLTSDTARERRTGNENRSSLPTGLTRNLAVEGRRNVNTADQLSLWSPVANTRAPVTQIRDSDVSDGFTATSDDVTENEGTTPRPLQRRYRNVPTRTSTFSPFPVQEETEEQSQETRASSGSESRAQEQNSANISSNPNPDNSGTNANGASIQSTIAEQGSTAEDTLPQGAVSGGTLPQGANADGRRAQGTTEDSTRLQATNTEATLPRGVNAEDSSRWTENATFSCAHYDRYCLVKFACCEPFWPCHRCHNSKSKCGEKKLKSRNIKKLKCRRCNKVQDFPKDSPHCVQCNLKFAEYFCPICQHLTGVQNHPFHCAKCGICRVHQDRSFHCDVCGVCLDVNLRNNHKCRAGSAHDKCVKCNEDAFTGCQILPCSHKVHKECANQMIKSGITRCPICNESFEHKVGKPKKPK